MKLILGTQSEARRRLFSYFNLPHETCTSEFDEEAVPFEGNPIEYANILSMGKNHLLIERFPDHWILTADTVVYGNKKLYGKPKDYAEAVQFIQEFAGNWHSVYTSLTLSKNGKCIQACEETRVLFHPLTISEIEKYFERISFKGKAGGYTIEGIGSLIISRIEGSYHNVMGLPFNSLSTLFSQMGINLWHHLG